MQPEILTVNGKEYRLLKLLGHGKGGYSYLAQGDVVVKQIHHEPCDYYQFGDKLAAEERDYARLSAVGLRMPRLLAVDRAQERLVKEYIAGPTVAELVQAGAMQPGYLDQVRQMAARLAAHHLNIDYYPTNFVVRDGLLYYVDYECNDYMEEWDFEHWGVQYWG